MGQTLRCLTITKGARLSWAVMPMLIFCLGRFALASEEDSKQCTEAWVDLKWGSVAVRCFSAATDNMIGAVPSASAVDLARNNGGAIDQTTQYLAYAYYRDSAVEFARAAYAYHLLKSDHAKGAMSLARTNAADALKYANSSEYSEIKKLLALLNNTRFFALHPGELAALGP